jgi:hypothetical protein
MAAIAARPLRLISSVAIAVLATQSGCQNSSIQSRPDKASLIRQVSPARIKHLVFDFDTSGSDNAWKNQYINIASRLSAELDWRKDYLTEYRVNCVAEEIFSNHPPESRDTLEDQLSIDLSVIPKHDNTIPRLFWHAAAERFRNTKDTLVIISGGDGDDDETRTSIMDQQYQADIAALAANRNIALIVFYGANPENRQQIRQRFASFKGRLVILERLDTNFDEVIDAIHGDRVPRGEAK